MKPLRDRMRPPKIQETQMIQHFRLRAVSIVLLTGLAFSSQAGVTISTYEQGKDSEAFAAYIMGIHEGFGWADAKLRRAGMPRLYCPPDDMRFTKQHGLELIEWNLAALRKSPQFLAQPPEIQANYPIAGILTSALIERYPCSEARGSYPSTPRQQPATVIQPAAPVYQPAPLPTAPTVPFPSPPGRSSTICRTLSNGTVVCD